MNEDNLNIKCELISDDEFIGSSEFDFDKIIFDLNSQIDLLSNQTDCLDYIVAIASGEIEIPSIAMPNVKPRPMTRMRETTSILRANSR